MILNSVDWLKIPSPSYDVVIIGSGAAGISFALELAKYCSSILILEGGEESYLDKSQDLYGGKSTGVDLPYGLKFSRLRMFGGSTNCWAGLCGELQAHDFLERSWVPNTGWPLTKTDLSPYYSKAGKFLNLGKVSDDLITQTEELPEFLLAMLRQTEIVRFKEVFNSKIRESKSITLYKSSNLLGINRLTPNQVHSLSIINYEQKIKQVKGKYYILASGGIENARILLNSKTDSFPAIGNRYDNVGRYFSDHPIAPFATIYPTSNPVGMAKFDGKLWAKRPFGDRLHPFYQVPFEIQKKFNILNIAFQFFSQENELSESATAAWRLKKYFNDTAESDIHLTDFFAILKDPIGLYDAAKERYFRAEPRFALRFQMEQAPNKDSRVTLQSERDFFGLPRASLNWKFTDLERRTIDVASAYLANILQKFQYATIKLDQSMLKNMHEMPQDLRGGHHHSGTTRMSKEYRDGVVDKNLKVFEMDNLYILGSSTFPTNGWVNPTMSIIAFSIRLADLFRNKLLIS
jgi:choline dehydrogenase-like flavoprotein